MEKKEEYRNELIKEIECFSRIVTLFPIMESIHQEELLCTMIENQINITSEALESYKNPTRFGIKGKLIKLESHD